MATKFCEDCAHFRPDEVTWILPANQRRFATCARTAYATRDSGRECRFERDYNWLESILFNTCGLRARYWTPKDTT